MRLAAESVRRQGAAEENSFETPNSLNGDAQVALDLTDRGELKVQMDHCFGAQSATWLDKQPVVA